MLYDSPPGASPVALVGKNLPANEETKETRVLDLGCQIPGGEHDNRLQDSCLENRMGRGAWHAEVHRVAKSQT